MEDNPPFINTGTLITVNSVNVIDLNAIVLLRWLSSFSVSKPPPRWTFR